MTIRNDNLGGNDWIAGELAKSVDLNDTLDATIKSNGFEFYTLVSTDSVTTTTDITLTVDKEYLIVYDKDATSTRPTFTIDSTTGTNYAVVVNSCVGDGAGQSATVAGQSIVYFAYGTSPSNMYGGKAIMNIASYSNGSTYAVSGKLEVKGHGPSGNDGIYTQTIFTYDVAVSGTYDVNFAAMGTGTLKVYEITDSL